MEIDTDEGVTGIAETYGGDAPHDAKARTVAITDSPVSPVARLADHVLLVRPTPPRSMASYAAIASLASALTDAVAAKKGPSAGRALRDAETLCGRFRVHSRESR